MGAHRTYDDIGHDYARLRRPDARLAARVHAALGTARSVLNVGAGAGAYEPTDRATIALEPSRVMLAQRAPGSAPAVAGRAEALPFADRSVDAVLAVLTLHHWSHQRAGLLECARVARERVVLFTWDPASDGFWLVREYVPAFLTLDRAQFPSMPAIASTFGARARVEVLPVPVPHDCTDGFLGAYWRRPEAYLVPAVQRAISSFARVPAAAGQLARLEADVASGAWAARHAPLLAMDELDVGYRLVVAHLDGRAAA